MNLANTCGVNLLTIRCSGQQLAGGQIMRRNKGDILCVRNEFALVGERVKLCAIQQINTFASCLKVEPNLDWKRAQEEAVEVEVEGGGGAGGAGGSRLCRIDALLARPR